MTESTEPPIEARHIGFLERRWNMVKAFSKKAYEHLFSVKTWVTSAVIFGTMAAASYYQVPVVENIASFFHVTKDPQSVILAVGKSLAIGTVLNAGIAMYKESIRCNECDALATQIAQMKNKQHHAPGKAHEYEYAHYNHSSGFTPPSFPGHNQAAKESQHIS